MLHSEFDQIEFFTADEVESTGASVKDVQLELVMRYDNFRRLMNRPVVWLPNGLTTGGHKMKEHPLGLAGDCAFYDTGEPIVVPVVFKNALTSGFRHFGAYHNGAAYSFHLGIGNKYKLWAAYKKHRGKDWKYISLLVDPAQFSK